jgi:hypothetical protein
VSGRRRVQRLVDRWSRTSMASLECRSRARPMAVIEVRTFRLADGVDQDEFLDADQRAQTEFVYNQRGLLRRTTARGADGQWLVVTLWASELDADASTTAGRDDPTVSRLTSLLDPSSVATRRYHTLD